MWQLFSISILVNSRPKEDLLFDRTYSQYMITVLLLYEMIYIYICYSEIFIKHKPICHQIGLG